MLREFSKGTEKFSVNTFLEPSGQNEARILFNDKAEVRKFFSNVMADPVNRIAVNRIAEDVAPSFCRPTLRQKAAMNGDLLESFYSDIHSGKIDIMLKHINIPSHQNETKNGSEATKENPAISNFKQFIEDSVRNLKKLYSRIANTDFNVVEKVFHFSEDKPSNIGMVTIDQNSVQNHESGWNDWDRPFEYKMFGLLKGLVIFNIAAATKLSNSTFLAAAAAYISEGVKCQYNMTGKSIIRKPWYGSFCIRFNLKAWDWEIAWVKYKGSGEAERVLVELNRTDRVVNDKTVLFTGETQLFTPFVKMENFLADYSKEFVPPERDILHPIRLNRGLLP